MIPIQLELTNFLSYRETAVLDFNGIHLACISGANGAGKSSILDAITWALFGQSRSRSDDDLVNRIAALNDDEAEVRLSFDLEGSLYRITRRRRAGKSSMLELQMASGVDDAGQALGWKTLSESKIRETQTAIETLLRMNYDTFINASFLLQGKADEFTTKTPNKRKEILADLLGVSVWDQYRERVTAQRKDEEGQQALLDAQMGEIETELGEEAERRVQLETAVAHAAAVTTRLADKERLLQQLQRAESAIKQQADLLKQVDVSLTRSRQQLAGLQQTRAQRAETMAGHQALLAEADAITEAFADWQAADQALHDWQAKADALHKIQQEKRPFELTIAQERSRLEQRLEALQSQAAQAAAAGAEETTVQSELAAAEKALAAVTGKLETLAAQTAAYQAARDELNRLQNERKLLAQEANQLKAQAQRIARTQTEAQDVRQNAAAAEAEFAAVSARVAALAERTQRLAAARGELDNAELEQPRLRAEMEKLRARIDQLQAEAGSSCPLCGQPLTAEHRHQVIAELERDGKEKADRFRVNKQRIADLQAETASLTTEVKQGPKLTQQQETQRDRLSRAQARLAEIGTAVTEWQESGQARLTELEARLADDAALQAQQQLVTELETAVADQTALAQQQQQTQRKVSQLEARLAELRRLLAGWQQRGVADMAAVQAQLESESFAAEARNRVAEFEAQEAAVGYDAAAHVSARQRRTELVEAQNRYQALKQAEAALAPLATAVADLDQQIAAQQESLTDLERQQQTAAAKLAQLQADGGDLQAVEDEVFALREEQVAANQQVGAAQQRLAVLDDLRARNKQLLKQRAALSQRIQRLKMLEKACGRDGVQALLIEQALPEIEERANDLLERLTSGEMRVSFETQRQLKSQNALRETLDIRIIDSAGERPYSNYSGGEQFRVNFAIRLALSQILAKRAGARLQTLVIDEGFGSQDPNGRQRLVEAINTIQQDFVRILVITHIDELRDVFPTRIEVEKTAVGSRVSVA